MFLLATRTEPWSTWNVGLRASLNRAVVSRVCPKGRHLRILHELDDASDPVVFYLCSMLRRKLMPGVGKSLSGLRNFVSGSSERPLFLISSERFFLARFDCWVSTSGKRRFFSRSHEAAKRSCYRGTSVWLFRPSIRNCGLWSASVIGFRSTYVGMRSTICSIRAVMPPCVINFRPASRSEGGRCSLPPVGVGGGLHGNLRSEGDALSRAGGSSLPALRRANEDQNDRSHHVRARG
jgi:hypothetical protein